ncbi:GntR family transcriptional regulator, partial [Alloalcanivorax venustensis]
MFFLKSDITGDDIHIYQQICIGIKEQILSGALLPNEKLPSKRKLADMLKVSVNSVTNAYEQLLAEGYIYSLERKGYYVENITKLVKKNKNINIFPKDLKEDFRKEDGWLSLSHMTSDISVFPFNEWMKCQRIAIHNHQNDLAEIVHPQGPYLVRKTLSRLIALSRGVICEPEQIVFGDSTQTLIRNLISMQEGNPIVAVEDPGYSRLYTMLKIITSNVLTIELDDKGIDIEKVESSGAKFLFVTPSHQFPTGIIMPISRRIELL